MKVKLDLRPRSLVESRRRKVNAARVLLVALFLAFVLVGGVTFGLSYLKVRGMGAQVAISLAHEGHVHKIMGTVSMRHEFHLEVKATDGKTTVLTLTEKTKVKRGDTTATIDSIKPGERVVVTAVEAKGKDGKTVMVASEVRLAALAAVGKK